MKFSKKPRKSILTGTRQIIKMSPYSSRYTAGRIPGEPLTGISWFPSKFFVAKKNRPNLGGYGKREYDQFTPFTPKVGAQQHSGLLGLVPDFFGRESPNSAYQGGSKVCGNREWDTFDTGAGGVGLKGQRETKDSLGNWGIDSIGRSHPHDGPLENSEINCKGMCKAYLLN